MGKTTTAEAWARLVQDMQMTTYYYAEYHGIPRRRSDLTPGQVGALSNRRHNARRRLQAAIERLAGLEPGSIEDARLRITLAAVEAS